MGDTIIVKQKSSFWKYAIGGSALGVLGYLAYLKFGSGAVLSGSDVSTTPDTLSGNGTKDTSTETPTISQEYLNKYKNVKPNASIINSDKTAIEVRNGERVFTKPRVAAKVKSIQDKIKSLYNDADKVFPWLIENGYKVYDKGTEPKTESTSDIYFECIDWQDPSFAYGETFFTVCLPVLKVTPADPNVVKATVKVGGKSINVNLGGVKANASSIPTTGLGFVNDIGY